MKRLLCAYRNASLRVKLSLLVTAVLLTVLIACQVALYFYVAENVERQARSAADVTLTQAQTYMDAKLRNVVERLFYIRLDPSFEGALTDYLLSDKPSAQGVAMTLLSPCLSLHKVTEPLISSIFLYTPKSSFTDMGVSTEQEYRFEASVLWRQAEESESYVIWGEVQKDEIFITHREVLPVMYRFSVDGYGGECVLLANIDKARLTAYLHDIVPDDGSDMLLVDGRGRLVTQAGGAAAAALAEDYGALHAVLETEGFTETAAQGGKYLTAHRALANAPWHVVYLQSEKHILGQLQNIRNVFFAVSLAVVLVLLVALTRIVHSVTQPLSRLSQRMRSVDVKNDWQGFEYPYHNEIGTLSRSFNSMLAHIHMLLDEQETYIAQLQDEKERVRVEQQLKRRAELKALQAQINPHFLYNTLDSIRWKAERAGAQDISRMTTALATLFRIGLSRGREIISVEQEAQHVGSYLQIQKLRYGGKLSYTVELSPDILQLYTVKLILQPLVENAIYHGIKESEAPGLIAISGRRSGSVMELRVTDNGPGIPPERLAMLQADLARGLSVSGEGYGIFNVNERIRLYFGAEYGLMLESEYGRGTVAAVRLPCITQDEVEQYVSLTDSGR